MTFVSYAQNREDVMLRRALAGVTRGFYVDVGANDPVVDSVTKTFHETGWRGINVEPVAFWMERLRRDRPEDINLQVAAGGTEGEVRFFEVTGSGLSTSSEEIARGHARETGAEVREYSVPMRSLTGICREHGVVEIHFLKIDVEGAERSVLEGLDLSRIRPWIVLVEATLPNTTTENTGTWEDLLTGRGYHHVWFDGLNRFYVADERAELDAAFVTPPNVWDAYETWAEHAARAETAAGPARIAEVRARLADSQARREVERAESAESIRQWRGRAEYFEGELHRVYASRSWRWTVLLRLASRAVREATYTPRGDRRTLPGVAVASVDVARRAIRKVYRRLAGNPGAASPPPTSPALESFEADLPLRARRVLAELREARRGSG